MNEILAPFIWLTPPPCGTLVPYRLFEGFLFRYLERYFCTDDHLHIHVAFKLFQLLLLFHDPQLAIQLRVIPIQLNPEIPRINHKPGLRVSS